jgi:hypothetical protein
VTVGLVAPILATAVSGCGANERVRIPHASPSAGTQKVELAPGVRVAKAQLTLPPYSTSTTYPLRAGTSAKTLVEDVQIDDLIENIAIERGRPSLLNYADSGAWLVAIQQEIAQDRAQKLKVISVTDEVSSMQAGYEVDPSNPAASAAVIVQGSEVDVERLSSGKLHTKTTMFDVLRWLVWSPSTFRYLTCDTGSS